MGVEIVAGRRKVGKMTENEQKAIRWMEGMKGAAIKLGSIAIFGELKEQTGAVIKGFEELEQYRAVGTAEECRVYKGIAEKEFSNGCLGLEIIEELNRYRNIGTPGECREAMERQKAEKPELWGVGCDSEGKMVCNMYDCPNCGESYEVEYEEYGYCPNCGQRILWESDGEE